MANLVSGYFAWSSNCHHSVGGVIGIDVGGDCMAGLCDCWGDGYMLGR